MAIQGIVFDFGGVISLAHQASFFPKMKALTGWERETILAGWARYRRLMDADLISVEEVYQRTASDLGETLAPDIVRQLRQLDYDSWVEPNPETFAWAKELKASGYKIGILTNMPTDFVPWFDRCAKTFRALADAELISGEVHLAKPQPEIYRLMEARIDLPPEALLFLDDTLANVEGAQACGWSAHQFTTVERAKQALASLVNT